MLAIIGCGNLNRSDDGVGVLVAQRLQRYLIQHPHPDIRVYDCGTGGMEVMFQARGCTELIIIDASCSDSEPGAVFEVPGDELVELPEPGYSLHDFRWHHAIASGRKIFPHEFPLDVTVYLIEAGNIDFGWDLTSKVEQALNIVCEKIIERISNM
ncbi:hydrogenase maturation protease [Calothrix sp. PCC 6303]|uniref:hydrogenase maturation protease n=1 Tax=Calothrix sp. PCC 6303 TaxID=1170562 RepID=UPI0002A01972|nr:hydrogenase maturation protease [Calothrix sp. PCC 6303]AFY99316.1 hydrogenase maturation protease [Calothrix sp. PCC 6303]